MPSADCSVGSTAVRHLRSGISPSTSRRGAAGGSEQPRQVQFIPALCGRFDSRWTPPASETAWPPDRPRLLASRRLPGQLDRSRPLSSGDFSLDLEAGRGRPLRAASPGSVHARAVRPLRQQVGTARLGDSLAPDRPRLLASHRLPGQVDRSRPLSPGDFSLDLEAGLGRPLQAASPRSSQARLVRPFRQQVETARLGDNLAS